MKKSLLILCVLLGLSACLAKNLPKATVDIAKEYVTDRDVLYLDATGYGKNKRTAIKNTQTEIYQRILLTGIPNTPLETALLNSMSLGKQEQFLDNFIEAGRHERYTLLMEEVLPYDRKSRSLTYRYKINLKALRNDLQKQNIIQPFGV